jgi:hypothetical protein
MRALVVGAFLLIAALGAEVPAAQGQVVLPPVGPTGYGGTSPGSGYFPSPLGIVGSVPPYGSDGLAQNSVCTDPTTGQQQVLPTAHVFDAIASTCVRLPPGQ